MGELHTVCREGVAAQVDIHGERGGLTDRYGETVIIFGTYKFQETKATKREHMHASEGYQVLADNALSRNRGSPSSSTMTPPQFQV